MISSATVHRFSEFSLDPGKRTLFRDGLAVKLRDREFDVLLYLVENAHKTCSPSDIISTVWAGTNVENNSVEKAIVGVRAALDDDPKQPRFIRTLRGKGYLFIGDLDDRPGPLGSILTDDQPKAVKDPGSGSISRNPLIDLIAATILIGILGSIWWYGQNVWAHHHLTVLFADDFSGEVIDPNRWSVNGKSVKVENGVTNIDVEETDNWGRLESVYFSFDRNKPLTIDCRMKVSYSHNLKDKAYFHGYFFLTPKISPTGGDVAQRMKSFGVSYANYDYEANYPDGAGYEQKAEGFFLSKNRGFPHKRQDYELGNVSPRIDPVWDKWFEQQIVYEPYSGRMSYFIDGELQQEFNVGEYKTDLPENELKLEISPEGWWLYHTIELDYIRVMQ